MKPMKPNETHDHGLGVYSNVLYWLSSKERVRAALTGAGHVRQVRVSAVVAIPAHADGGSLRGGPAVGGTLQAQSLPLTRFKCPWGAG